MSISYLVPDILREVRNWFPPQSYCPWGAILLIILVLGGICWLCGFICAAVVFSNHCRRVLAFAFRTLVVALHPSAFAGPVDLRGRLAEYQRS